MANNHETLTALFTDIADAIREKTGGTEPIVADTFPTRISGIVSTGEDLYPTASRQTTSVDILLREVKRKIADHKGEGGFVWKKYIPSYTVSFTQITSAESPTKLLASSNEIDLTTVDASFFEGLTGTIAPSTYEFLTDSKISIVSSSETKTYDYTYDASTKQISILNLALRSSNWGSATADEVILGFVVSSDPEAYPDGGEQDGFWYERVSEGVSAEEFGYTKMAHNTFTFSTNQPLKGATFVHGLDAVPKLLVMFASGTDFESGSLSNMAIYPGREYSGTYVGNFTYQSYTDGRHSLNMVSLSSYTLTAEHLKIDISLQVIKAGVTYELLAFA